MTGKYYTTKRERDIIDLIPDKEKSEEYAKQGDYYKIYQQVIKAMDKYNKRASK